MSDLDSKAKVPTKKVQPTEWKKRFQMSVFVLLLFVLLAIIGSIFYQYTGGNYTAKDAYRDLGFYDPNANVNTNMNVNTAVGASTAANINSDCGSSQQGAGNANVDELTGCSVPQ